ncbi:nucleoside triphosphate pyrophosphohydrolase [Caldalkalibacillus salinus]|uniref:nucleoside triphosphate pyrophosphohydrolase n=1 Tax=Caldalkalibacillus salinus TaxID=2803787 RepID=UPI0019211DF2|nr:nucleoside triphosphate pyrophosphohydrolase [Caldalkalibacillus salinus]
MTIYNKLVRDRIPEIIRTQSKKISTQILDSKAYHSELRKKLKEEFDEYLNARSNEEALEELADIQELLRSLAESHGFSIDDLERVREEKANKKGEFKERIFLVEVED